MCLTPKEIQEIVENGQLMNMNLYNERIKSYQIKHGIEQTQTTSATLQPAAYDIKTVKLNTNE